MQLYRASILNPQSDTKCDLYLDGALLVDSGEVVACGEYSLIEEKYSSNKNKELIDLRSKVILPCFSDIHFHWVQDDVCLMPKANLMAWLEMYTWPAEAKFEDPRFSKVKADFFFERLNLLGTKSGAIYSSVHEHAVDDAFAKAQGDFLIGAVMMTKNSPHYLLESVEESITKTSSLAKRYSEKYIVSPRFAPSCTDETLVAAAKIAKDYNCWIQTHLAETKDPEESSCEILDKAGLLTNKTILGHCIYLDNEDYELLAQKGSVIAHCPSSNASIDQLGLGSGLFDFHRAETHGVDWALATDIGAGPYLSMLDVMKSFYEQNLEAGVEVSAAKALYRATCKGCELMGLSSRGNLNPKMKADFITIDSKKINFDYDKDKLDAESLIKKILDLPREEFDSVIEKVYSSSI